MIIRENESETSPDELAKLRAEALRRLGNRTNEESAWRNSYDQTDYQSGDGSLKMSRYLAIAALAIIAAAVVWPASFSILFAGWGILLLYCLNMVFQEKQKRAVIDNSIVGNHLPLPQSTTLWGIIIPLAVTLSMYAILPMNSLKESSSRWMFLTVLSSICCAVVSYSLNTRIKKPKMLGFLNGITIGTALSALALFGAVVTMSPRPMDFSIILPVIGLLLIYSSGLMKKLLLSVDRKISISVFCTACVGALITFAVGIAPELRGLAIALGEKLAVSSEPKSVDAGYKLLKELDASRDLEVASDPYHYNPPLTLGTAFIPVGQVDAEKMYFFLTGKTHKEAERTIDSFQNAKYANPDEKVAGLSLAESKISGHVDVNSLTSVTYWTMVFGNTSNAQQEAQAKISLPPNSAVSRVTLWVNGKPQEAAFNSTQRVTQAYEWITQRHRDPLLITETARGVINLQAFPVPKFGEMKVRIGVTSGLDAKSRRDFNFIAPHIISSNFGLDDAKTFVKLESNAPISSNAEEGKSVNKNGKWIYTGQILPGGTRSYQFVAHRTTDFIGFSARATHSKEDMIISEQLVKSSTNVSKLAVVIDGSEDVSSSKEEIKRALAAIPKSINAKVFLADHREDVEALPVDQAIGRLSNLEYSGGVDDTRALVAAQKYVGRNSHAAIVWIHGPQPIVFAQDQNSLRNLMISGEHRLKVYDFQMSVEDQGNEVKNYLTKLDRSASPVFLPVEQGGSVEADLTNFFKSSAASSSEYSVVREKVTNPHSPATSYDFPVASRLSTIWAADEARRCAEVGEIDTAVVLGTAYRVVTPATGAVVMELQSDYDYQNLHRNFYSVVSAKTKASVDTTASSAGDGDGGAAFEAEDKSGSNSMPSPVSRRAVVSARKAMHWSNSDSGLVPPPPPMAALSAQSAAPSADAFASAQPSAPSLMGATSGTIGPQGSDAQGLDAQGSDAQGLDATMVQGVNTAGTVRVDNLATLERTLDVVVRGLQALSLVFGAVCLYQGFFIPKKVSSATKNLLLGSTVLLVGLAIPGVVNYLLAMARDLNMFS